MPSTPGQNGERTPVRRAPKTGNGRFRPVAPIVEAKLAVPMIRPGTVARERVLRVLETQPGPPVVALVAPVGYGKTTALAQLAARQTRPVVWLTVDELDNDPAVFLSHLLTACDRVARLDSTIQVSGTAARVLGEIVPGLLSSFERWPMPGLMVLDDIHLLTNRTCLDALNSLIAHLPASFQLAVAARSEPRLALARLRAQGGVLEVGPSELALSVVEAGNLSRALGCELSDDDAARVNERTEGWPAGVYLLALSLRQGRRRLAELTDAQISERYIFDYLRSEFQDGLGDEDLTLLTRSVVLERVSPRAAAAVSEMSDAGERLRRLADANLLIQRVPADEPSYRYHNLLRDFLARELEEREPGSTRRLHLRATDYYEAVGRVDRAIEHALKAGDGDNAARLIVRTALATHHAGRASTVDRWLSALAEEDFERHPSLAAVAAWTGVLFGRPELVEHMVSIVERADASATPEDGSSSLATHRAMLAAVMARNGPRAALDAALMAVSLEPPGRPWRPLALLVLGWAYRLTGDFDAAGAAFDEAIGESIVSHAGANQMLASAARAAQLIAIGDWQAAQQHASAAQALMERWRYDNIVSALPAYAVAARVAIWQGEAERGRAILVRAQLVRSLVSPAAPWLSVWSLLELARAYLALSDSAGAQLALREAETIVRHRPALGTLTDELVQLRREVADARATLVGSSALTAAELRVLPFLPTYLSFEEIAERLMISRNTVKTHAMSIYGKLWASSRSEAVERAVEIGLLEQYPALNRQRPRENVASS
jgi:LuxR family transcriptional regulator, maltose regulon positive regulatory protein